MKLYELMYLIDPNSEDKIDEIKQKIEGIITGREGSISLFEKLGKKRLAYPIAKRQYGIYFLVNFEGDGSIIQALESYLLVNPTTLRHIVLAFAPKEMALLSETKRIQQEEAERMRMGGRPIGAEDDSGTKKSTSDSDSKTKTEESDSKTEDSDEEVKESESSEPKTESDKNSESESKSEDTTSTDDTTESNEKGSSDDEVKASEAQAGDEPKKTELDQGSDASKGEEAASEEDKKSDESSDSENAEEKTGDSEDESVKS